MAIAENGPGGNHRGKLGNSVYYVLNGKNVSRGIGITLKPPTQLQLKSRMETKLSSGLLSRLLDFLNTGFGAEALMAKDNAFNQAVKYNKKNMIKGSYPDLELAYDQLLVSKGALKPAQNCSGRASCCRLAVQLGYQPGDALAGNYRSGDDAGLFPKTGKSFLYAFWQQQVVRH